MGHTLATTDEAVFAPLQCPRQALLRQCDEGWAGVFLSFACFHSSSTFQVTSWIRVSPLRSASSRMRSVDALFGAPCTSWPAPSHFHTHPGGSYTFAGTQPSSQIPFGPQGTASRHTPCGKHSHTQVAHGDAGLTPRAWTPNRRTRKRSTTRRGL